MVFLKTRETVKIILTAGIIAIAVFPGISYGQLQELEVNRVTNDGPIPVIRDHPDLAAIFIRSSLPNLTFESNLEIVEERGDPTGGEYILLISPLRQSIRINAPGYMQTRLSIGNLNARDVVYYSVEPAADLSDNLIPIFVRVEPSNAVIRIDGEPVNATRSIPLEPGSHAIHVSLDGYRTVEEEIVVNDENSIYEYNLEELEPVSVRFITDPPESFVTIDGTTIGQTDQDGVIEQFRFPGTYSVTVSNSSYMNEQREVKVLENEDNEFSFTLERALATLSLSVEPNDARVEINRQPYDDISSPIELSPGVYRVVVSRNGYQTYESNIRVEANDQIKRNIELEALTGNLLYSSSPSSANATLYNSEGRVVEEWSGILRMNLPIGDYRLVVHGEGYELYEENITIENGETLQRTVNLEPDGSEESLQSEKIAETQQDKSVEMATLNLGSNVDANIFIDGDLVGKKEISVQLDPGIYRVDFRYESGNESIEVDLSAGQTLSRTVNFRDSNSNNRALTYSIFAPGVGHIASNRSRGYLYLAAGVGTAAFTVWSLLDQQSINSSYNDALEAYEAANSTTAASGYRTEAQQLYNDNLDAYNRTRIGVIAFSAIHVIQLADIALTSSGGSSLNTNSQGFQIRASSNGMTLRYRFN